MFSHPDAMRIYTTEAVGTIFGTLARFFRIANSTPKGAQPTPADGVIAMPVSERIIRLPTVLNRTGLSRSTLYRQIAEGKIGRAHVCTPVTNAHLVCRLLLENKNITPLII